MLVNDMAMTTFYKLMNVYTERHCAPFIKSGFTIILFVHFIYLFFTVFSVSSKCLMDTNKNGKNIMCLSCIYIYIYIYIWYKCKS